MTLKSLWRCVPVKTNRSMAGMNQTVFRSFRNRSMIRLSRSSSIPMKTWPAASSLCPAAKTSQPSLTSRSARSLFSVVLPTPLSPRSSTDCGCGAVIIALISAMRSSSCG